MTRQRHATHPPLPLGGSGWPAITAKTLCSVAHQGSDESRRCNLLNAMVIEVRDKYAVGRLSILRRTLAVAAHAGRRIHRGKRCAPQTAEFRRVQLRGGR